MRNKIVQAMDSKFRADLMSAQAKLEVYLENPVGVGEHPDIPGEAMKCVTDIVEATEKIKYVQSLYLSDEDEAMRNITKNKSNIIYPLSNFLFIFAYVFLGIFNKFFNFSACFLFILINRSTKRQRGDSF